MSRPMSAFGINRMVYSTPDPVTVYRRVRLYGWEAAVELWTGESRSEAALHKIYQRGKSISERGANMRRAA